MPCASLPASPPPASTPADPSGREVLEEEGAPAVAPSLSGRLARAISTTGAASVVTLGLSSLGGIIVARWGGPRAYASFVAASMVVYVTSIVAQCGLPWAVARLVALEEEAGRWQEVRRASSTTMLLLLLLALVASVPLVLSLRWIEGVLHVEWGPRLALWLPLALLGAMMADGADGIYFGLLRAPRSFAITASGPLALVGVLGLRRLGVEPLVGWPVWSAVIASNMASGICALGLLWRDGLWARPLSPREMRGEMSEAWGAVLPSAAFSLFSVFGVWIDRAVVGAFLGGASLGLYAAAASLLQLALRVPMNLSYLLLPASLKAGSAQESSAGGESQGEGAAGDAQGKAAAGEGVADDVAGVERSQRLLELSVRSFGLCAGAFASVLWLGGAYLLRAIFGPGFVPAASALSLMTPALMASAVSAPALMALKSSGSNRLVAPLLLVALPLRAVLLATLTPAMGLGGAALAFSLAEAVTAVGSVLALRRARVAFPLGALLHPLLTSLLAVAGGSLAARLGASPALVLGSAAALFAVASWPLLSLLSRAARSS